MKLTCGSALSCLALLFLFACDSDKATNATKQTRVTRIGEFSSNTESVTTGPKSYEYPPVAAPKNEESNARRKVRADGKPSLIVTGRITNPDGSPCPDVLVQLVGLRGQEYFGLWEHSHSSENSTHSDKNGQYELATAESGYVILQAEKPGSAKVLVNIFDGKVNFVPGARQDQRIVKNFSMSPAVEISGRIIDDAGSAVTSASISAVPDIFSGPKRHDGSRPIAAMTTATVAADGTFRLRGLLAEPYLLTAENSECVPAIQSAQAPAENLTITMSREGSVVEGTVVQYSNRQFVPGAKITLSSAPGQNPSATAGSMMKPRESMSEADGSFHFALLPPGTYMLHGKKDDVQSVTGITVTIAARETTSGITLALSEGHTISGTVTDQNTGEPIPGVAVGTRTFDPYQRVSTNQPPAGKVVRTDEQGGYRLGRLFGSTVQLSLEKKGYKTFQDNRFGDYNLQVPLPAEQLEIEKNFQMWATVSVTGVVKLENGRNAIGAEITPFQINQHEQKVADVTDSNGMYEVEVMPYANIRLKAALDQFPATYSELIEVEDQSLTAPDMILQAGGSVAGTVVGPDDQPVPDATVSSYVTMSMGAGHGQSDRLNDVKTDAGGNFLISNVPQGHLQLNAEKKGYARAKPEQLDIVSRDPKTGVKLKLKTAMAISGRISDEKNAPVQRANVNCWSSGSGGGGQASTDDQGKYRVEDLAEGTYEAQVYAAGFDRVTTTSIKAGSENVDFVLKPAVMLTPEQLRELPSAEGVFIGKVIDWSTRRPVTTFKVNVDSYGGTHRLELDAPNGTFTIRGIYVSHSFQVRITAPGYLQLSQSDLVFQSSTAPTEQEFVMGPGGTITGRVVSKTDRTPLVGVSVQLHGIGNEWNAYYKSPEKAVRTGADGTFSMDRVTPGTNWLHFRPSPPLAGARRSIDVEQGKASDLGDIEMGEGAVLAGKLVRVPGDEPIADAQIEIMNHYPGGSNKSIRTDANGEFRQSGLLPGEYSINVREHNISAQRKVEEGETVHMTLKVGSRVLNGLVTKRGTPVSGVSVSLNLDGRDAVKTTVTDAEGKFTVEGLADALWRISVIPPSIGENAPQHYWGLTQYESVEVSGNETSRHIELFSGRILGSVLDTDGKPLGGATLKLTPPKNASVSYYDMVSSPDGTFSYDYLPPGEYVLTATRDDGSRASQSVNVPAHSDVANVVLRLEKTDSTKVGTLVSTTLLMDGKPISWPWCNLERNGVPFEHNASRDNSGRMVIKDIPEGVYKVDVSYWKYSSSQREVEIKAGETVTIDDVLYLAGALRWTIQDKSGTPMYGVQCTLTPNDPNSIEKVRSDKTDAQGQFVTRGLFAGDYTGTATLPDGKNLTAKIHIIAGELTVQTSKAE